MLSFGRLAAITFIFFATCCAWYILGTTIHLRTQSSAVVLGQDVASTWGSPQAQRPPSAYFKRTVERESTKTVDGKEVVETKEVVERHNLPLRGSDLTADIALEHRQKGLLWYSTYRVKFGGDYRIENTSELAETIYFALPLPAEHAVYDNLVLSLDGDPLELSFGNNRVCASAQIPPGETATLGVAYASQGLDSWAYVFGDAVAEVRDFSLQVATDFERIDFAPNSLSPVEKTRTESGWLLDWTYQNLLSGYKIQVDMPSKLQPGPLAGRISYFAPVSLFFFFFAMVMLTTLRRIPLHPMNYFFLAAAFFAFHLLLAYLADHISIHFAFVISAAVSLFLVVSYLRLVLGLRFAAMEAGGAQFLYLVLFSYAFFFEGFTGLSVTIGAIMTLFVAMQLTGRVRWNELNANRTRAV